MGALNQERTFQRAQLDGRVYIHDDFRLFIAPLDNISAGGIFIHGLTKMPKGHQVKVVIKTSHLGQTIQATGAVVRIENKDRMGCAVQFEQITAENQQAIQQCVYEMRLKQEQKTVHAV